MLTKEDFGLGAENTFDLNAELDKIIGLDQVKRIYEGDGTSACSAKEKEDCWITLYDESKLEYDLYW